MTECIVAAFSNENLKPTLIRQKISLGALALSGLFSALAVGGFVPDLSLSWTQALIIAGIGGALAGPFYHRNMAYWWRGLIAGVLVNFGAMGVLTLYAGIRANMFRIEIVLAYAVGMIPGVVLYYFLLRDQD
jgi:hypothetical protein